MISPAPGGGDGNAALDLVTSANAVTDFPKPGSSAKIPPRTSAYADEGRDPT